MSAEQPTLTVVVPAFNEEATLRRVVERVRLSLRNANGNISLATNSAAELAHGEFLVFLDQDDLLTPDALAEIALAACAQPDADILYSDDDKIDVDGHRFAPQFKPDWSPELLLGYMYFSHVFAVRRALYESLHGMRAGFEGSQDYDLALRASERARAIARRGTAAVADAQLRIAIAAVGAALGRGQRAAADIVQDVGAQALDCAFIERGQVFDDCFGAHGHG